MHATYAFQTTAPGFGFHTCILFFHQISSFNKGNIPLVSTQLVVAAAGQENAVSASGLEPVLPSLNFNHSIFSVRGQKSSRA